MKNILEKLQNWLAGPFSAKVQKLTTNPYMRALQSCFTTILPMIIVGSLSTVIGTLRNFLSFIPDLSMINNLTFGLISIFMVYLIPYNIMENKKLNKQKTITGFAGISVLLALANPQYVDGNIAVNSGYLGTGGMTVAIFVGLLVGFVFSAFFKHGLFPKNTKLPSIVVTWFESIVPIFFIVLICIFVGRAIDLFGILEVIFTPVANIGNTYIGFVLLYLIMALCYCMGLSAWAIWPIVATLCLTNIAANAAAVAAGNSATYILTDEVIFMGWCCIGGLGSTLALNILMIRSKSKKISAIGKAAISASIFNINEPVMYGLPVVLNPIMMLGYLLVSFVIPTLTYIVLKIGLVTIPSIPLMMNYIPQPIATYMINSDFRGVILWVILFILSYILYYPFFKAYEKQEVEKEEAELNAAK